MALTQWLYVFPDFSLISPLFIDDNFNAIRLILPLWFQVFDLDYESSPFPESIDTVLPTFSIDSVLFFSH